MNDVLILAEKSLDLVVKHFEVVDFNKEIFQNAGSENPFETLIERLTIVINDFLDHDMGKLLNILYKIDVNEKKIKLILSETPPQDIAHEIAMVVVEREKQKVLTRAKYRD